MPLEDNLCANVIINCFLLCIHLPVGEKKDGVWGPVIVEILLLGNIVIV